VNYLSAQSFPIDSSRIIQFSGKVVTEENNRIIDLPYTTIAVKGTSRGTYSGMDGFFSLVALKGEVIVFSRIGYKTIEYTVPDTMQNLMYSIIQIMSRDRVLLPETVIYAWPSREHFDIEFLAMDVSDVVLERAMENLDEQLLLSLRETLPADGGETGQIYLKEQAQKYYYAGQYKPQNIFNPIAWKKFIDAWRRGDFKKKKDKK
jgi:hypothetical protein